MEHLGTLARRCADSPARVPLQADDSYRDAVFATLDCLLADADTILSLDIFDTLLLRCDRSELRRFFEIGGRMASAAAFWRPIADADAFVARLLGTEATYRAGPTSNGCREGCLSEIHLTASRLLAGDDRLHDVFVEAELQYEASTLTPSLLLDYVALRRARGGRSILITDMYMREAHVRRLLAAMAIDDALFDGIFSSADFKVSKASGGIFDVVEHAVAAAPKHFVHVGDNAVGDFQQPRRRGWRAVHLPIADAERSRRRKDHHDMVESLRAMLGFTPAVAVPT